MSQQDLVDSLKKAIEANDTDVLFEKWGEIQSCENDGFDWPTVFQTLYLHACLKGRIHIASWLQDSVFPTMDPIQKIALRQVFSYGRHLLKKAARV